MGKKPKQKSVLKKIFLTKLSDACNCKLKFFWCAFRLHVGFGGISTISVSAKNSFFFVIPQSLQPHSYIIELLVIKV